MIRSLRRVGLTALLLCCLVPASARAQNIVTGELQGSLADSTGAAISNALVTLRTPGGSGGATATTESDGRFSFAFVLPGRYELQAEALGWRPVLVRLVRIDPGKRATVALLLAPTQPPVERRDTLDSAALPTVAGANLGWLGPAAIADLPASGPALSSLLSLDGTLDEALGMDGLPARLSRFYVDGHPFHAALHPAADADGVGGLIVPRSAVRSAGTPRATDVEWAGGGGAVALATGASRQGAPAAFGLWAGDAGWNAKVFEGTPPTFTSFWAGAGATLALVRDTAMVHVALETGTSRRPLVALATDSLVDRLGEDFGVLALPGLAESTWTSGSLKLDWTLASGGALQATLAGASFTDDFPGRAAPVLRYRSPVGAAEGTDLVAGVDLGVPIKGPFSLELRTEGSVSRRTFGRETEAAVATTTFVDSALTIGGPPQEPGEVRRTEVGGTAAVHFTVGPHEAKAGIRGNAANLRYGLFDDPRGTFVYAAPARVGTRGVYTERTGTLPPVAFVVPSGEGFAQYRWAAAPGVTLTVGGTVGLLVLPVDEIRRDEQWLKLSGLKNDSMPKSPRYGGGIAHGAWDPTGRNRTVLEGALGLEYGEVDPAALWEAIANNGVIGIRRVAGVLSSWPNAPASSAGLRAVSLTLLDPELAPPRTSRALVGLAHRFDAGVTLRVEATARRTELLLRRADLNVPTKSAFTGEGDRPVRAPLESFGGVVGTTSAAWRRFTEYDAVWALNGDGWSRYRGLTVGLDRELGGGGVAAVSYTYSETTDNLFGLAAGDPSATLLPTLGGSRTTPWEEGRSDLDVPHRGSAALSLPIPGRLVGSVGAVYRGRSGSPFTPMVARGLDVNGDGSWSNDVAWIPAGDTAQASARAVAVAAGCADVAEGAFAKRNSCRGSALHEVDLRLTLGPIRFGRSGLEATLELINATDQAEGVVDDGLLRLDSTKPITTSGTKVTIPYRVNPRFGSLLARSDRGRQLRLGVRVGAPR